MSGKEHGEGFPGLSPLKAGLAWLLAALGLLIVSSFAIANSALSSRSLGYAGSAISFLAALLAAAALVREQKGRGPILGLLTGAGLCAVLLLAGSLIDLRHMSRDAVLSLCTFTLAGALVGSLSGGKKGKGRKKHSFSHAAAIKRRT